MKSWDVTFIYRWRVEAENKLLAQGKGQDHLRDQFFEKDFEQIVPPDSYNVEVELVEEEDARTFKMEETNWCDACKDCPSRSQPKETCYEGDPWYKCPKYNKHETMPGAGD